MDTLAMLEELLEQNQFELLIPKDGMSGELRLVYLMNDAVESFLVFKNARMTGAYLEDYEGETEQTIEGDLYAREMELLEKLTVGRMPKKRKAIYEMSRREGLSNDEIAIRMGISKKTVENHLNLALKEIRKTLLLFASFFI